MYTSKSLKIRLLLLLSSFCLLPGALAEEGNDVSARKVIEDFQNILIETMKQGKQLGYTGRFEKLKPAIESSHDLQKITRIVVGKGWKDLTEDQKKKVTDSFSELSIAAYAKNFDSYSGEKFVLKAEDSTARGGKVFHYDFVLTDAEDVKFQYHMIKSGNNWLIVNVIANGVSDLALRRSEYASILERENFDTLITKIKGKIKDYSQ